MRWSNKLIRVDTIQLCSKLSRGVAHFVVQLFTTINSIIPGLETNSFEMANMDRQNTIKRIRITSVGKYVFFLVLFLILKR